MRAEAPQSTADALLASGISLTQQDRYAEAIEAFRHCVAVAPERFEAHYDLALSLFALKKLSEAREAIEPVRPRNGAETAARAWLLGKVDAGLGNRARARAELSAAFRAEPADENHAIDYGLFLVREGDYQTAMTVFTRAADAHPQSLYVLLGLAMAQAFGGKHEAAVTTCRGIMHTDPQFSPALLVESWADYMSGEYGAAERASALGLRQAAPAPYLYYLHAAALLKLNATSYGQMLAELDAAERGIPSCALCYFVRSKVHEAQGDLAAATADLSALVSGVAPDFDQAWYRLARLYGQRGLEQDAHAALARYRAIRASHADPELELARGALLAQAQR